MFLPSKFPPHAVHCHLCGSINLSPLINFGSHSIGHHYLKKPDSDEERYPIEFYYCKTCGLSQIVNPIPPDKLYTNYFALSSYKNQPHIPHEVELIKEFTDVTRESFIIEIASNDGIFCKAMLDEGYYNIIGVEPAQDAYLAAKSKGIHTIHSYFNMDCAKRIVEKYGHAKLIIARQVLEHISNLQEFQEAIKYLIAPNGYLFLDVPDFQSNLETYDYSLWEEHVNQFTIDTLKLFSETIGCKTIYTENYTFSGRCILLISKMVSKTDSYYMGYLPKLIDDTLNYKDKWLYFKQLLSKYLENEVDNNKKIAIYGAGGRVGSLINYTGIAKYISCIVDDLPEKQGLFMPESQLPIYPSNFLYSDSIDICLLAVNTENEEAVIQKHKRFIDDGGKFYSILPPSNRLLPVWKNLDMYGYKYHE
ncbi:MAG TPA: class I SAM-dependent methyltransferase [Methanocorpusculum sp.]|nr:class I SAM-dependent methyltransferase [Methanocorpusculum sp.]